jgi:type I restriction enzyme M protein
MLEKERLENLANEIWKGAIKLRGKFKAKDYPLVILPMILIRRIECVLMQKRDAIEARLKKDKPTIKADELARRTKVEEKTQPFYNTTTWTLKSILKDNATQVDEHFRAYLNGFSPNINEIIDKFKYREVVTRMVEENRLATIMKLVEEEDLSPTRLSNIEMGYVYEHLLQKFSQDDAKDTGEHFTPREIIRIMVDLMEIDFDPATAKKSISIYDPACGTGGMLSVAKEHLLDKARSEKEARNVEDLILLNGQELLAQNYAMCKADMILKGEKAINITHGNSLIPDIDSIKEKGDQHQGKRFDYMISNPPFGVDWGEYKTDADKLATSRYRAGMPPSNDGALLFLQTMVEKMKPASQGGSKIAVLFNGSPLSNGDATQGESDIRRHILENDLLDTIVMLPGEMFYNTGIYTYIWLLSNVKDKEKKDKVMILNAREKFEKEPKSFGSKRNRITEKHREWIQKQFSKWRPNDDCKVFHRTDFAYHKVAVVYWQHDEHGRPQWITEPFDVQLNNGNVQKRVDLYGDFHMLVSIPVPTKAGKPIELDLHCTGDTPFETLVADALKESVKELAKSTAREVKAWFKAQDATATYHHRHYIEDNEYLPFDRTAKDKQAYIEAFLKKEIEHPIISWTEYDQLGYEILPNKYFYKYEEPVASDVLIEQFWALEKEAEQLLSEIRAL